MARWNLLTLGCAGALGAALWRLAGAEPLLAWLSSVTAVTLVTYGYDKAAAGSRRMRVPERVLLTLALAGGTAGALAGMHLFRHKTAKGSFQLKLWLVIGVQVALVAGYYHFFRR